MKVVLASVVLSMLVLTPAMAQRSSVTVITRGAPAPLLGAGLPGLGMALGYGAYWLARRRRNEAA